MSKYISFRVDGHVAEITLDRPDKLHALNVDMLNAMAEHVQDIDRDHEIRVLVITSTGDRSFCCGADIIEWSAMSPVEMWRTWIKTGSSLMNSIRALAIPVITSMHGLALGGGLELALAADIRIASTSTRVGMPEAKLGIIPGWGGTQVLKQVIGPSRTKQLIFTGEIISAAKAESWGLINEVVEPEEIEQRTASMAEAIASNAPIAVQATKALVDAESSRHDGPHLEGIAGALTQFTEDAGAGVEAFKNKQRTNPAFHGR
ncbi:MAG: enoyl-CoA hydratase/isomerase family protein [Caldilineaceae bacterium]|nr:enoyl-CoA hydratase/isomerase family protein [Caldilineaceae bacterium]